MPARSSSVARPPSVEAQREKLRPSGLVSIFAPRRSEEEVGRESGFEEAKAPGPASDTKIRAEHQ